MSAALRVLPVRAPRADESRELCVVVACHQLVFAIAARQIERLVLPEQLTVIPRDPTNPAARGLNWRLVLAGKQPYAACNLGTQLGMGPVDSAWALLRVRHRDGSELPIALQTGPCLVVQQLAFGIPLPTGVFGARVGAVAGAFSTQLLKSKAQLGEVALRLDLAHLWAESELDDAAAILGRENERE